MGSEAPARSLVTDEFDRVIAMRLALIQERIARACDAVSRDPASVTLIAVSKGFGPGHVATAWRAGQRDFGENRVQEGVEKAAALMAAGIEPTWHFIGHLQRNKVTAALGSFAILHAVDSERLLTAVEAAATGPIRVLIEVNVAAEETKFGVAPAELHGLLTFAKGLSSVRVEGLMTVAPRVSEPEAARPVFHQLRELAERHGLATLSMGMSDDFEAAIAEGSTHVRIGRAIFGERA